MSAEKRKKLIEEARQYVTKDRNTAYGEPEDNFSRIAEIWSAQGVSLDGRSVNASDVALMMAGMKLARLRSNPNHRDSWVDLIGYAACGGDVALTEDGGFTVYGVPVKDEDLAPTVPQLMDRIKTHFPGMSFPESQPEPVPVYGWQSDNRCAHAVPHGSHRYHAGVPVGHQLKDPGNHWCDGYKAKPLDMVHGESDLDVIKRVAEKTMRRQANDVHTVKPLPTVASAFGNSSRCDYVHPNGQRCKGVAHGVQMAHDFGPLPKPIRDNPQA